MNGSQNGSQMLDVHHLNDESQNDTNVRRLMFDIQMSNMKTV